MCKKFLVRTLGCKTNQIEGQIIAQSLVELGFIEVDEISQADIFILNSCSVTSHSDSQVSYILNKAKRQNPSVKTVLTGCFPQQLV